MDDDVDRLYGLPLEEFVAERDALAKSLRADKRREDADAVKALRKPSVAAWAVNQALRTQPDEQAALLEAGDALRAAQDDLLEGRGDAATARAATETERQAVGRLVTAARGLARDKGFLNDAVLDRVRETLHAAATDEEARAEVQAARVSRERRPAAFGGLEGFAAPAAAPAKRKPSPSAKPKPEPKRSGGRKKAGTSKADAKERAAQEREREAAEREAERERKAAEREAERARLREAKEALKEARAEERAAGRRRREAEAAVHTAERELSAARTELEAAEAEEHDAAERKAAAEDAVAG